jgi:hypothetical protein
MTGGKKFRPTAARGFTAPVPIAGIVFPTHRTRAILNFHPKISSAIPPVAYARVGSLARALQREPATHLAMKNSLIVLALILAAATPAAFIIELAGTVLPTMVDSAHLFGAFMLTFLCKILLADYARTAHVLLADSAPVLALPSPAAAKSSFRLAA